jgi:hypothetical protein
MSAKYNEHPMERKARVGIEAYRKEKDRIDLCYRSWLEQLEYHHAEDVANAYKAGYAQGKYDAKIPNGVQEGGAG